MSSGAGDGPAQHETSPGTVLDRVEEAVYALNADWQFTYLNDQATASLDRERDELLGECIWDVFPEAAETTIRDQFQTALETGTPQRFDTHYEPMDAWFTVRAYPGDDGLTVCFYDVTEERGRQLELQRKQRLFEAVFEDTEDALVIADTDRQITDFNPAAERLFGYDAADVEGENAQLLYADENVYEQQGRERFNEDAQESHESYVVTYERADGTTFDGETVGTPLKGPDGETLAYLGAIRNVSERLAYEREIEDRNEAFREFHDVTTDETRSPGAQMAAVLELGCSHLDLDTGVLASIDGQEYTVEHVVADDDSVEVGDQLALEETCCERVADRQEPVDFTATDDESAAVHPHVGAETVEAYLGAPVFVDGEFYGTVNFASQGPHDEEFDESDRTFARLLAQWVGKELSRRQSRNRARANRDRLRQIIDMLPQLVFAKDDDGEFLLANEAVAEAYGTTVEELEGAMDADFADSQEEAEQFRADDRAVIESGEPKHIPEESLTTADGDQRILETTKIPYDPVETDGDAILGVATDITELKDKQAELEVQSAAMEASMDGIAILDADDEYIYMNEAHADIFDYEPAELISRTWRRLYDEDEIERLEAEVFPEIAAEGEWRGETAGRRKDGSTVYQEITLSLLDDGKLICTNRDITEQKEREQELERQRTRLRALFDESPDGIVIHDDEGNVVDVNETQTEALGYDREELLSMNVAEFEVGFDQAELEAVWADMDEGDTLKVEGDHQRRDGSTFPVEVWVNKVEFHGRERFIAVGRDITERKERERELTEKTTQLEAILEHTTAPMFMKDTEGTYVLANRQYREVFGFEEGDVVGKTDAELHPEQMAEQVRRNDRNVFETGESVEVEEHVQTGGSERIYLTTKSPIYGLDETTADDLPSAVFGVANDITERKERDRELRELTERLDLAVEGANLGVWDWNIETDAVTFNDQWAEMLGLSPEDVEPHLDTWEERVHPGDMDRVEAALEAHMAGEAERHDCEHRMLTASGDWKWIRDVGEVVERDADGNPTRAVGIHIDISDQKETETYLEEERDMFAQGPAIVFKWQNAEGWPVEYVSENVTETLGYTPDKLESGDVPYENLVHDDDLDRVSEEVAKHTDEETERFSHDPYRMVTSDGGIRWVTDNTKIIRNDGEVTHYLGYLVDITERKQLEDSLRDSKQSLRELTAIASDTDRDFETKLDSLLELGRERLDLPYAFLNRIEDGTQHVVQARGDHALLQEGESAPLSKAYCRKTVEQDGLLGVRDAVEEGWAGDEAYQTFEPGCYLGGTVTVDGDRYGTLCFAGDHGRAEEFDSTDRAFVELLVQWVSYELAGETAERKLRGLNETAQQLMSVESETEIAQIAVESAEEVLGMPLTGIWRYDEDEQVLRPETGTGEEKTNLDEKPTFSPGESPAREAFETGEVAVYADLESTDGVHNDETALSSEVILPLGDYGVIWTGSTDERAFSEADLSMLEVLSATVEAALDRASRERMLRETQQQLEQSNEQLEQFAYAASHDLQEPLRTVSSYLTLLDRRYGDQLDGDATEFIDIAVEGADRMQAMIQALLEYSRVDTQGQAFTDVEMGDVFDQVRQNLEVTIAESGGTVECPDAAGTVTGDQRQLVQLFQNLVENGIKYSDGQPHVDVSVTRREEEIEVAVADDGIGIDPDQREQIFEVFQRLHTSEEFSGTGIGLSLCQKIADRHGGNITVESTPGEGSTFVVTLPTEESHDE